MLRSRPGYDTLCFCLFLLDFWFTTLNVYDYGPIFIGRTTLRALDYAK